VNVGIIIEPNAKSFSRALRYAYFGVARPQVNLVLLLVLPHNSDIRLAGRQAMEPPQFRGGLA
jgi:hypothetical protein